MNLVYVIAGLLLVAQPFVYARQMRKIATRIAEQGKDPEPFEQKMSRPWLKAMQVVFAVLGVVGLTQG